MHAQQSRAVVLTHAHGMTASRCAGIFMEVTQPFILLHWLSHCYMQLQLSNSRSGLAREVTFAILPVMSLPNMHLLTQPGSYFYQLEVPVHATVPQCHDDVRNLRSSHWLLLCDWRPTLLCTAYQFVVAAYGYAKQTGTPSNTRTSIYCNSLSEASEPSKSAMIYCTTPTHK